MLDPRYRRTPRKRSTLATTVLAAVLVTARGARAEDVRGLELGVRVGMGLPFGKVDGAVGDSLDQTIAYAVPVGLDVGYRVDPRLLVGAYGTYASASPASALRDDCSSHGLQCSTDGVRAGIEVQVHSPHEGPWDPWMGLGSGYEWMRVRSSAGPLSAGGWEFLHLEAGVDLRPVSAFGLGPFVTWAIGQYQYESFPDRGSSAVSSRAVHEWLIFGFRGTVDIGRRLTAARVPAGE
jgi:hypothetical protein